MRKTTGTIVTGIATMLVTGAALTGCSSTTPAATEGARENAATSQTGIGQDCAATLAKAVATTQETSIDPEMTLAGQDLSGLQLQGCDFTKVPNLTFEPHTVGKASATNPRTPVNLSGANLAGANLENLNVSVANLRGADLTEARLSGANLSGADLSPDEAGNATKLIRAQMVGTRFQYAEPWTDDRDSGPVLTNLTGAKLNGSNLSKARFNKALLKQADFSEDRFDQPTNLTGTDFRAANCDNTTWSDGSIRNGVGCPKP